MTTFAQLTLDGFPAPSAKVIAINRVEQHADPHWLAAARTVVNGLAQLKDEFTTDDVWERLALPREPRAIGAVMRKAAQDNLIAPTGRYVQSTREVNHQRPVMVWRSLVR